MEFKYEICVKLDVLFVNTKKHYYQLNEETKEIYKERFINKLPYPLNTKIRAILKSQPSETTNTLRGIIQILYNELRQQCL